MKIKSARAFRTWFKINQKNIAITNKEYDENFIGTYADNQRIKGFFEMYHGDKPRIKDFLKMTLKMAQDDQAIYEFLQNAVDCGSTHFFAFYNDNYLLVINNGKPFNISGISSLLNIAQSDKKDSSLIGRLGVGFKLVHRLVGKNDGVDEMVDKYLGPIVFSWSKISDLQSLLNNANIEYDYDIESSKSPYLFKIIATNFIANPEEEVLDFDYNPRIVFSNEEKSDFVNYMSKCLQGVVGYESQLKSGSAFFIKLGRGKCNLLNDVSGDLISGIQYSMNTLKQLTNVYINNEKVSKIPLKMEEGKIQRGTEIFKLINPEYKNYDIKFSVGYNLISDYNDDKAYQHLDDLKECPSFYKYFPMGDERHKLALFVHSDSFSVLTSRRKLNEDDTNLNLLPAISQFICSRLSHYKDINDKESFKQLYVSLLLSDLPHNNSPWLQNAFYNYYLSYIKRTIPVEDGYCELSSLVKIKKTSLNINLQTIGLEKYHWLDFSCDRLCKAAKNPALLNLKEWDILDIISHNDLDVSKFNELLITLDDSQLQDILDEINNVLPRRSEDGKTISVLRSLKLFKFESGSTYCYSDIIKRRLMSEDNKLGPFYYVDKKIFYVDELETIKDQLIKWGFEFSAINYSNYKNIKKVLVLPPKEELSKNFLLSFGVFYSEKLNVYNDKQYKTLQLAFETFFGVKIPDTEYIQESNGWKSIFIRDYKLRDLSIKGVSRNVDLLNSLIEFSRINSEHFFKSFIIFNDNNEEYSLGKVRDNLCSFFAKGGLATLVKNNFDNLYLIPKEIIFKDSDEGIIKEDKLHCLLLNNPNFGSYSKNYAKYVSSKHRLEYISKISKIEFNIDNDIEKDSFEYNVLVLACKGAFKSDRDKGDFLDKITIVYNGYTYGLTTDLFGNKENIEFCDKVFNYSKLFPNSVDDGGKVIELLFDKLSDCGFNRNELSNLIDLTYCEPIESIFNSLNAEKTVLVNAQQLAFVTLYMVLNNITSNNFFVSVESGSNVPLAKSFFYFNKASYISPSNILTWQYKGLTKFIDLPCSNLVEGPYVENNKLCCPGINSEWDQKKQVDLLETIYDLWCKDSKIVKQTDFSRIENLSCKQIFGFSFSHVVFPDIYAYRDEVLPLYIKEWLKDYDDGLEFLEAVGINYVNSNLVKLRQYLSGELKVFDANLIDSISIEHCVNTIHWFVNSRYFAKDLNMIQIIRKILERSSKLHKYHIHSNYDYETINTHSREWDYLAYKDWNNSTKITIKVFDGQMIKSYYLDDNNSICLYNYSEDDYCIKDKTIFVNGHKNIKEILNSIVLSESSSVFTKKEFNRLESNELYYAQERIKELEGQLAIAQARIKQLEAGFMP